MFCKNFEKTRNFSHIFSFFPIFLTTEKLIFIPKCLLAIPRKHHMLLIYRLLAKYLTAFFLFLTKFIFLYTIVVATLLINFLLLDYHHSFYFDIFFSEPRPNVIAMMDMVAKTVHKKT